jgi:phosphoribosylanthranilate isomerase
MVRVKYCGLTTQEAVQEACALGAGWVGCVFYPPSPRHITPEDAGRITQQVPATIGKVAVTVDADDALLDTIVAAYHPEFVQCHGNETPARIAAIRARCGVRVIKALPVRGHEDIAAAEAFHEEVAYLLWDAKPDAGDILPGGNGRTFPWELLARYRGQTPWFLAGGLTPANIRDALQHTGAVCVDVSSGIESMPGQKDLEKMRAFAVAVASV